MHSGTKYFNGHSDALIGTVSVQKKEDWAALWHQRTYTGATPGSLEAWLVLRSLRTLSLRVTRQAKTATALAQWLTSLTRASPGSTLDGPEGVIETVWHASLQKDASALVGEGKQMSMGPATFAIQTTKPIYAEWLGHVTKLFVVSDGSITFRLWLTYRNRSPLPRSVASRASWSNAESRTLGPILDSVISTYYSAS